MWKTKGNQVKIRQRQSGVIKVHELDKGGGQRTEFDQEKRRRAASR